MGIRLYRVVFGSRVSVLSMLLLCLSFLLQPVEKVFANESIEQVAVETSNATETTAAMEELPSDPPSSESVTQEKDEASLIETPAPLGSIDEANLNSEVNDVSVVDQPPSTEAVATEVVSDLLEVTGEEIDPVVESDSVADPEGSDPVSVVDPSATTSVSSSGGIDDLLPEVPVDTATMSEPTLPTTPVPPLPPTPTETENPVPEAVVELVSDPGNMGELPQADPVMIGDVPLLSNDRYQFDRSACIAVGNGNYHCVVSDTELPTGVTNGEVYAAKGEGGDIEIFLQQSSRAVQITKNDTDDSSPQYDPQTNTVVWQRTVDGQSQIILYDVETETETQISPPGTHNMEPAISGKNVVWQQWDGADWEIALFDGQRTTRLSDNDVPDLAPSLEEEYVVWSTVAANGQYLQVYSLKTGLTKTITDHEGGRVANPRFVLVYDTKLENGDTITHTFDPVSGESMPVATVPHSEPVHIPPVEPTGETKALIQYKSTQKEELLTEDGDGLPSLPNLDGTSTSSSPATGDLILEELPIHATTSPTQSFELSDYDLIISEVATSAQPIDSE